MWLLTPMAMSTSLTAIIMRRSHEIWYTMRDNNGNTLIDDTPLTPDDGVKPSHPTSAFFRRHYIHITCCEDSKDCVKTVDEGRRHHVAISAEILT